MKKANRTYFENFYTKKAVELNAKLPKEEDQIYEGLKHYSRLTKKYGLKQVQHWFSGLEGKSNSSIGGDQ